MTNRALSGSRERSRVAPSPPIGFDPGHEARTYRPANGMEGAIFMSRFCDQCERDRDFRENEGDSCPIAAATMAFDAAHDLYPKEWIEDGHGARCTAFQQEAA